MTYEIMDAKQLADFILEAPFEQEFYFADTWDEETPEGELDGSCCEGWWGFKKIHAFDSDIVIFGWGGGGSNWCAEVNPEYTEDDVKMYLKDYVQGTTKEGYVVLEREGIA
jgi:hypothetical protein